MACFIIHMVTIGLAEHIVWTDTSRYLPTSRLSRWVFWETSILSLGDDSIAFSALCLSSDAFVFVFCFLFHLLHSFVSYFAATLFCLMQLCSLLGSACWTTSLSSRK